MAKPTDRVYARYTLEALRLMGRLIRLGRIRRRMTVREVAERAGLSRALVQRIEKGDPGCAIGAVFEAAFVAGVPLFEDEALSMPERAAAVETRLALMPKAVRVSGGEVKDDF